MEHVRDQYVRIYVDTNKRTIDVTLRPSDDEDLAQVLRRAANGVEENGVFELAEEG